jgi:asparagine synthetase B (glutamine-hydrolysing)
MKRFYGSYGPRSKDIDDRDWQVEPTEWANVEGFRLPINGPFTQVVAKRGTAILYVSQPGELPLYWSIANGKIFWHEQRLALPWGAKRIDDGTAIVWTPVSHKVVTVDHLPLPAIEPPTPQPQAIAQYLQTLINSVKRRVGDRDRVAVSQSGGVDSLMITWALLKAGIEVVPLTVCTGPDDLDIIGAKKVLAGWGLETTPLLVTDPELTDLAWEAALCTEDTQELNAKMAVGNILMARKCVELGLDIIFNGHAQDDIMGRDNLMPQYLKQSPDGTASERWSFARRLNAMSTTGMRKMFSTTFRRYGIHVRMPYFDQEVLTWVFSQPIEVLPQEYHKTFAWAALRSILPAGVDLPDKHSLGYVSGAGMGQRGGLDSQACSIPRMQSTLADIKTAGWQQIHVWHVDRNANSKRPD